MFPIALAAVASAQTTIGTVSMSATVSKIVEINFGERNKPALKFIANIHVSLENVEERGDPLTSPTPQTASLQFGPPAGRLDVRMEYILKLRRVNPVTATVYPRTCYQAPPARSKARI